MAVHGIKQSPVVDLLPVFTQSAQNNPVQPLVQSISDPNFNQQPTPVTPTSHLKRDGTKSVQSGSDIQNTQGTIAEKRADIQKHRQLVEDDMQSVKNTARDAIVAGAATEGVARDAILGSFAKSSPELEAATELMPSISIQIAQMLLDYQRDRKSLGSKQVARIASKAASIINGKAPKNDTEIQKAPPVTGQDVLDIMNETWRDKSVIKDLDAADLALDELDQNLNLINTDLETGVVADEDILFNTQIMADRLDINGINTVSFAVAPDLKAKIERAADSSVDNEPLDKAATTTTNLKTAFTFS